MATKDETIVQQVDVNLDELLGLPGVENIVVPTTEEPKKEETKPNVFSKEEDPTAFLNNVDNEEEEENVPEPVIKQQLNQILDEDIQEDEEEGSEEVQTNSTPRQVSPAASVFKKLIENEIIYELEDDKPLDEYNEEDFANLLQLNMEEMRKDLAEEFFEGLPKEFQIARKYYEDGGRDLKPILKFLTQLDETRALDPNSEEDAEIIVRRHLANTAYGDREEIEEEILKLRDRDELVEKARKFKPKLDAMEQEAVAEQLAKQEMHKKKMQQMAQTYVNKVGETLRAGELNGLKLDKKTQSLLFSGLVEPSYPSASGTRTNLLGHLLEKYQYVEPNHGLIAEALWLLADPKGYKNRLMDMGKNQATANTTKALKIEQSTRTSGSSSPVVEKEERTTRKIKGDSNFFKRV